MGELAIEVEGLRKVYRGGVEALRGVDLHVPAGCCFGLLGPNGAGKSTLVKALLGIVHATSGSARLLGRDHRSPAAREGVGYLPEGHAFPPYLTGFGVCRYFGRLAGLRGKELERDVAEKLALVGMADRAHLKVTQFSKGMKQRVGLAQALLGRPRLIFLDEPTDGLDPVGRTEVREVVRNVVAGGTTVFFNSHLLAEVEQVCDELAILSKGELLQRGTVDEVRARVGAGEQPGRLLVRVVAAALSDEVWAGLAARGAVREARREGGREGAAAFTVPLGGRAEIPGLIDELRAREVALYEVRPLERTLEQAFVALLRGGADAAQAKDAATSGAAAPDASGAAAGGAEASGPAEPGAEPGLAPAEGAA
ncbi:MAG: ABC transporter ATP-binding protein [Planctomycetota bacterium]